MPKAVYCHAQLEGKKVPLKVGGQAKTVTYPVRLWREILSSYRIDPA